MRKGAASALVALLLGACAPKPQTIESANVHIYSTVPIARLVAASVIQKEQIHEGYYWAQYESGREEYTVLYKPSGDSGEYIDDVLLFQEGKNPHYEYVDLGVSGGVSLIISLDTGAMILYDFLPADEKSFHQQKYLSGLLAVGEEIKRTEDIKALEQITPP
ncbi:hypothetical protein HZC31_01430 [Candidatus Woesearchaeota archaeon]|nr:hypothetical protein [Candidatus Woesearchaeota archaeon]